MKIPSRPGLAQARVTSDTVLFTIENDQLKVLLIKRASEPFAGQLAVPGGFVWERESTLDTAQRILHDKAGVQRLYLEQLFTFDMPGRDPRGHIVSVAYLALAARESLSIATSDTTEQPILQSITQLPGLAFDHAQIVDYALKRLRSKLEYTTVVAALLPEQFSFAQLQQAYELILNHSLDRRNFRKKFMSLNLIEPTGDYTQAAHRPAELFRFVPNKPQELKRWF